MNFCEFSGALKTVVLRTNDPFSTVSVSFRHYAVGFLVQPPQMTTPSLRPDRGTSVPQSFVDDWVVRRLRSFYSKVWNSLASSTFFLVQPTAQSLRPDGGSSDPRSFVADGARLYYLHLICRFSEPASTSSCFLTRTAVEFRFFI